MVIELCKLLNEVKTSRITTEKGEKVVLNNRVMIYQGKNKSTFIDITAWNEIAEFIERNFNKDEQIFIEGVLRNKPITVNENALQTSYILVTNAKIIFGKNETKTETEGCV